VTDLREFTTALLESLPSDEGERLTLTAETIPTSPPELETDSLLLKARFPGRIYHPTTRCDLVDFIADKRTYRALRLLVLGSILHQSRIEVRLRCSEGAQIPGVTITDLVIDSTPHNRDGLIVKADGLHLLRIATGKPPPPHGQAGSSEDRPVITWSNIDKMLVSETDWQTRSVVHGFGPPSAAARVAGLLPRYRSASERAL
jgi:hypothetical protein